MAGNVADRGGKSNKSKNMNFIKLRMWEKLGDIRRNRETYCGKIALYKSIPRNLELGYLLRNFRGSILDELSAHEILVNYESSMLENSTFVCLYFSKGQQIYLETEYIFQATIIGVPFIF